VEPALTNTVGRTSGPSRRTGGPCYSGPAPVLRLSYNRAPEAPFFVRFRASRVDNAEQPHPRAAAEHLVVSSLAPPGSTSPDRAMPILIRPTPPRRCGHPKTPSYNSLSTKHFRWSPPLRHPTDPIATLLAFLAATPFFPTTWPFLPSFSKFRLFRGNNPRFPRNVRPQWMQVRLCLTDVPDRPADVDHEMPKGRRREREAETDEPTCWSSSPIFVFSPFRVFAILPIDARYLYTYPLPYRAARLESRSRRAPPGRAPFAHRPSQAGKLAGCHWRLASVFLPLLAL